VQVVGDRDVGLYRERVASSLTYLFGSRVDVGLGTSRAHDIGAGLGERDRARAADALPRAGDDRDATVEAEPIEDHAGGR
jgi:hypothetical protein